MHPTNTDLDPGYLWPYYGQVAYQLPDCERKWAFTHDQLHRQVEALYQGVCGPDERCCAEPGYQR